MTTSEAGIQGREFTTAPKFPRLIDPHWPFVGSVIVVDNRSFNYSNRNVSKATEDILNVINLADSHLSTCRPSRFFNWGWDLEPGKFINVEQVNSLTVSVTGKVFIFILLCHMILGIFLWPRIFLIYLDWFRSQEYATVIWGQQFVNSSKRIASIL